MTRIGTVSLAVLLTFVGSVVLLPAQVAWASSLTVDAPTPELLSDEELAAVSGGKSKNTVRCLTTLGGLSLGLKFGGAWLTTVNPVAGIAAIGLGLVAQAAMVVC